MPKKILIVDDTTSVRMLLRMILKSTDYELVDATDGVEAFKFCNASSPPDLVLLDIIMPNMDGIECCRLIKAGKKTKHIPVIMVTTKGEAQQMEAAYAAGCDDYLTKPINRIELLAKIKAQIGNN